jgi:RND family efflux transporter MFP subunit
MKLRHYIAAGLGVAAVTTGIWFIASSSRATDTESSDNGDSAVTVTTAPIRTGEVSQTITAYGNVTAPPAATDVLSVGTECIVTKLRVSGGETVDAGTVIIDVQPSPDTKLQLIDARNALDAAKKAASSVHQRLDLKLATNGDAQVADQAVQSAQSKLDDLIKRGAGEDHRTVNAEVAGIIAKIDVQPGQLVPAGAPLVEVIPRGQIEVRLGIEPADAALLHNSQTVLLFPPDADDDDEAIDARVRLISKRINSESRLVDVFVSPSDTDALLLDGFVRGQLTTKTVSGLVVPREALLPDDDGFSLFTVADGKAFKHPVKVALQNENQAVVLGSGLHEGDPVIVSGVLEVDDQSPVKVSPATTSPAVGGG